MVIAQKFVFHLADNRVGVGAPIAGQSGRLVIQCRRHRACRYFQPPDAATCEAKRALRNLRKPFGNPNVTEIARLFTRDDTLRRWYCFQSWVYTILRFVLFVCPELSPHLLACHWRRESMAGGSAFGRHQFMAHDLRWICRQGIPPIWPAFRPERRPRGGGKPVI